MSEDIRDENLPEKPEDKGGKPEIDWSQISPEQVPWEVVTKHPGVVELKQETISRRKELDELKKPKKEPAPSEDVDKGQQLSDFEKRMMGLVENLSTKIEGVAQNITERDEATKLKVLASQYQLSEQQQKIVSALPSEERESTAAYLGSLNNSNTTNVGGGVNDPAERQAQLRQKVRQNIRGEKGTDSLFTPDAMRNAGGGVITNN